MHGVHDNWADSRAAAMDLEQLRSFLRVDEQQRYTRAAVDLGLSQSASSHSIQKLEEKPGRPGIATRATAASIGRWPAAQPAKTLQQRYSSLLTGVWS